MGRRTKRSRRKNVFSLIGTDSASPSPAFTFSIVVFLISVLLFIHQCVLPLAPKSLFSLRLSSRHRHHQPFSYHASFSRSSTSALSSGSREHDYNPATAATVANSGQSHGDEAHTSAAHPAPAAVASPVPPVSAEVAKSNLAKIPRGPFPLPPLAAERKGAAVQVGSSWSVSLARGLLPSLPIHWAAEVSRAASALAAGLSFSSGAGMNEGGSIFTARQKGEWIGCTRPHHLVCKGVYRAIKAHNSLSVLSLSCGADVDWLPHILRKLRTELRPVRLYCGLAPASEDPSMELRVAGIERVYKGPAGLAGFVTVPNLASGGFVQVEADKLKTFKVDMLIAYRRLAALTLIDGVKFLRTVKASGMADLLVLETFPEADNAVNTLASERSTGRNKVNVGAAPFFFPAPVFEYVNEDEQDTNAGDEMEIVVVKLSELFAERMTPEMKDLVDPRKRLVLE